MHSADADSQNNRRSIICCLVSNGSLPKLTSCQEPKNHSTISAKRDSRCCKKAERGVALLCIQQHVNLNSLRTALPQQQLDIEQFTIPTLNHYPYLATCSGNHSKSSLQAPEPTGVILSSLNNSCRHHPSGTLFHLGSPSRTFSRLCSPYWARFPTLDSFYSTYVEASSPCRTHYKIVFPPITDLSTFTKTYRSLLYEGEDVDVKGLLVEGDRLLEHYEFLEDKLSINVRDSFSSSTLSPVSKLLTSCRNEHIPSSCRDMRR